MKEWENKALPCKLPSSNFNASTEGGDFENAISKQLSTFT